MIILRLVPRAFSSIKTLALRNVSIFTCFFHPTKTIPAKKWLFFSGTIGLDRLRGWIPVDRLWKEKKKGRKGPVYPWSFNMVHLKISCWERSFQTWKIPSIFQVKQRFNFGFILAWAGPQTPGSSPWIPWRSFINIGKWIFYSLSGTWFWFVECARFFSLVCVAWLVFSPRLAPRLRKAANTETTQLVNGLCPYLRDNEKALMCLASFLFSDGWTFRGKRGSCVQWDLKRFFLLTHDSWLFFLTFFDTTAGGLEGFWKDRTKITIIWLCIPDDSICDVFFLCHQQLLIPDHYTNPPKKVHQHCLGSHGQIMDFMCIQKVWLR